MFREESRKVFPEIFRAAIQPREGTAAAEEKGAATDAEPGARRFESCFRRVLRKTFINSIQGFGKLSQECSARAPGDIEVHESAPMFDHARLREFG